MYVSYANTNWVEVEASSFREAKAAAEEHCIFTGQALYIGEKDATTGEIKVLAVRRDDPINMRAVGKWRNER